MILQMNSLSGQDLKGKWLMSKNGNTYSTPKVHIIKFSDTLMTHFEFDKIQFSKNFIVENSEIIANKEPFAKFQFINDNRIRLFFKEKINSKDSIFEFDYVRLVPTKSELSSIDIEKLEYKLDWEKENVIFKFNKEILNPKLIELSKIKNLSEKMIIERIDFTLFVSIYRNGTRDLSIPIKEVARDLMIVYGISDEINDLKAYRIDE